jgi:hypothetical protein
VTPDDFVYVIRLDDERHKIGISKRPAERLHCLQISHPSRLEIVYLLKTNRSLTVERESHRILAKHRLRGEWFAVDAKTAIEAVLRADRRYPPKGPPPLSKSAAKWAAFVADCDERKAAVTVAPAVVSYNPPRIRVSLPFGPTARKPGSMLKNR